MLKFEENFVEIGLKYEPKELSQLLLKKVKLLAQMRVAWLRNIWALATENLNGDFTIHNEIDGYLSDRDLPHLEAEWYKSNATMQETGFLLAQVEDDILEIENSRLAKLATIFDLNQLEIDIIQLCFCHAIEPDLGRIFAYLHDNSSKNYVTEHLVSRLFRHGSKDILKSGSPIKQWALIKEIPCPNAGQPKWEIDPFIKNWLLGINDIDEVISNFVKYQTTQKPLPNWPITKTITDIKRILDPAVGNRLRVYVEGEIGSGRKTFAAVASEAFGLAVLAVNSDAILTNKWTDTYMLVHRQALLSNAAIVWYNEAIKEATWPTNTNPFPLQFIVDEGDSKIFDDDVFINYRLKLPKLTFDQRLAQWQTHVPISASWPQPQFEEMVLSHETTIGKIVSIGKQMTPNIAAAYEVLQADSSQRLGALAQLMSSNFTINDLVLSDLIKKEIENFIFEATERNEFWEQTNAKRLFPQGKSLIGLFTGNPGTGKTMTAQVIANSLKLELYRVDLAAVVSKYIGESAKNMEKILKRAQNMNVVLLFDEADSLFGKRTDIKDSHDRYANTDTNYLLQAIENYPGIIILASNKVSNIDNGFMRRFRYLLDFREPDAVQRLTLWKKILDEMTSNETVNRLENTLFQIANHVEITGAQIKQAVLSTIFLSRKDQVEINASHIFKGIERELIKQGKSLNKQLLQNLNN